MELLLTLILSYLAASTIVSLYRKAIATRRRHHVNGTHQRNYMNKLRKRK